MSGFTWRLPLVLLLLCACDGRRGGVGAGTDTGDTGAGGSWSFDDLAGACPADDDLGGFEVAQWDDDSDGFATVTGEIYSAVIPTTRLFALESEGDCQLHQQVNPHCDPACDAGEVCTHEGECEPYPVLQELGTAEITGLAESLTLESDGGSYWDTSLPYPLFEEGAAIALRTTGGEVDPLALHGLGVAPLDLLTFEWAVSSSEDLVLQWTPAEQEARVRVSVNVDQHGNSPITLRCDMDDDGEGIISASLVEIFLDYGVSGFASGSIVRQTADSIQLEAGCTDLRVYSQRSPDEITVEGHTPCYTDDHCPEDQHCDMDTNTCVED